MKGHEQVTTYSNAVMQYVPGLLQGSAAVLRLPSGKILSLIHLANMAPRPLLCVDRMQIVAN